MLRRILLRACAGFVVPLLLISCMTGGSSSTETDIKLSGRVLDKNSAGTSGVVVRLAKTGIADTTDQNGAYQIKGTTDPVSSIDGVLDTLVFVQDQTEFANVPVTNWKAVIPDIRIIQREISANLTVVQSWIAKVEAVISGDGIPATQPVRVKLGRVGSRYSGFAYFQGKTIEQNYSVFVQVFDSSGRVTGRSQNTLFTSDVGNVPVDAFSPTNAIPVALAGRDTTLPVGATLQLHGTAIDSFAGTVSKWEWKMGNGGFVRTGTGDTVITLPAAADTAYPCVLRVTDNDGNSVLDTLKVKVLALKDAWSAQTSGTDADFVQAVAPGGGLFVAIANAATNGRTFVSADGVDWVRRDAGSLPDLSGLVWTGAQWVAAGNNVVFRSTDAVSWTTGGPAGKYPRLAWTGSKLVAAGQVGSIATSADGVTWQTQSSGLVIDFNDIVWTGTSLVAVGSDGIVATSPDGATWTQRSTGIAPGVGHALFAVAWNGSQLVAVGDSGRVLTSPNGVTWTQRVSGTTLSLSAVTWAGDRLVAVGKHGTLVTSPDGITWTVGLSGVTKDLTAILWTGTRTVILGKSGVLLTAP